MKELSRKHALSLALAVSLSCAPQARAVTIEPGDYIPAPEGTNLFLIYFNHTKSDSVRLDGVGQISEKTDQETNIGLLRLVRFGEVAEMPFNYQLIVPGGSVSGRLAGNDLSTHGMQLGDPMLGFVLWPIADHDKGRYLGLASITSLPLGSYDRDRMVSLGANTWSQNFQAVFTQKFGENWMLDFAADVYMYGDNGKFGRTRAKLERGNTYEVQAWISKQVDPLTNLGVGYSKRIGGKQLVDGVRNGLRTENQQLRFSAARFVTDTVQLQSEVYRAFETRGGYEQDYGLTVRFLKVF